MIGYRLIHFHASLLFEQNSGIDEKKKNSPKLLSNGAKALVFMPMKQKTMVFSKTDDTIGKFFYNQALKPC